MEPDRPPLWSTPLRTPTVKDGAAWAAARGSRVVSAAARGSRSCYIGSHSCWAHSQSPLVVYYVTSSGTTIPIARSTCPGRNVARARARVYVRGGMEFVHGHVMAELYDGGDDDGCYDDCFEDDGVEDELQTDGVGALAVN